MLLLFCVVKTEYRHRQRAIPGAIAAEEVVSFDRPQDNSVMAMKSNLGEASPLLHANGVQGNTASSSNDRTYHSFSRSVSHHWDGYVASIDNHPLLTKSITAAIILGTADVCAQGLEHLRGSSSSDAARVNWPRAARFAAIGLGGAPWGHFYFYLLDYYLPPTAQPWSLTTMLKVCIDQFVQAPLLLAVMICALGLTKGEGLAGVKRDLGENFVDALIANCKSMLPILLFI